MRVHGWLLISSLFVLPGPLFGQGPPSPQEMQRERAATFNEADADGDGTLSQDESGGRSPYGTIFRTGYCPLVDLSSAGGARNASEEL